MNIQIYADKRNFDVQKAERYFKERRVPYQFVDMNRHVMGRRELCAIRDQVGLRAMIDVDSKLYAQHYIRQLTGENAIFDALVATPKLLRTPIVRNGRFATIGYCPEVWAQWN